MRKPSSATVIALVALFVSLGGAGMAATGGNFILGQANTASTKTLLDASAFSGKALEITNTNTGSNATALSLNVATNHAPLVVSSGAGKATNLNADRLDDLDSKAFFKGQGYNNVATRNPGQTTTLLAAPYFTVGFTCRQAGGAAIGFANRYGGEAQVFTDEVNGTQFRTLSPQGLVGSSFTIITPDTAHLMYDVYVGGAMADLDVWAVHRATDCYAAAHATIRPQTPGAP